MSGSILSQVPIYGFPFPHFTPPGQQHVFGNRCVLPGGTQGKQRRFVPMKKPILWKTLRFAHSRPLKGSDWRRRGKQREVIQRPPKYSAWAFWSCSHRGV